MPFVCSRHTAIQTFKYKIIHRNLTCNEWLNNIEDSDAAIAINYCILYAKHFIYKAKISNLNEFTIDILSYLSHPKYVLKIEEEKTSLFVKTK